MQMPIFHGALDVVPSVTSLASTIAVPGFGALAANAYLLDGSEPVLIDAGVPAFAGAFVDALASRIDLRDLRYVWLTHCDADHVGALEQVLARAPQARVVTSYLGMGKLSMRGVVSPERFYLMRAGETLHVGGRALRALAMPTFDAPETMGVLEVTSRTLFSSDCFGALLSEEDALAARDDVGTLDDRALAEGIARWTHVDAPWIRDTEPASFRRALEELERLEPEIVLGAHLPPARRALHRLVRHLDAARHAEPFVGPNQAELEAMLAAAA